MRLLPLPVPTSTLFTVAYAVHEVTEVDVTDAAIAGTLVPENERLSADSQSRRNRLRVVSDTD